MGALRVVFVLLRALISSQAVGTCQGRRSPPEAYDS